MLLARLASRSKPLGVLRASCFGVGNAGCNGPVAAVLMLNRAAGGVPGKRRKHKGDFKASQPPHKHKDKPLCCHTLPCSHSCVLSVASFGCRWIGGWMGETQTAELLRDTACCMTAWCYKYGAGSTVHTVHYTSIRLHPTAVYCASHKTATKCLKPDILRGAATCAAVLV